VNMEVREDRVLADLIKSTHCQLREQVVKNPALEEEIWRNHAQNHVHEPYAQAMKTLSNEHWTNESRLKWISDKLNLYFLLNDRRRFFQRLQRKMSNEDELFSNMKEGVIKVLDVGSCHNPLAKYLQHQESYR